MNAPRSEPHTTTCPCNKFAVGVIFAKRRDRNNLFAEYGGIDYRQYCVVNLFSFSLSLSLSLSLSFE